jgi:hypothetical protein
VDVEERDDLARPDLDQRVPPLGTEGSWIGYFDRICRLTL